MAAVTVRIAMWSGPRNLSTALMRSFGNRPDCSVVDEPLYAAYLEATGLDHPGRDEVIASQPTDPAVVGDELATGPVATPVQYQKHMTHHLLPDFPRDSLGSLRHAFLVRDPERVLTSYAKVRDEPTLEDLGLPQQVELFEAHGGPVVDAADVLRDPRRTLGLLCDALGIGFDEAMLSWPAGPRDTDGVWAPHWYAGVEASTGFAPYSPGSGDPLPDRLAPLLERCRPYYDALAPYRLRPVGSPECCSTTTNATATWSSGSTTSSCTATRRGSARSTRRCRVATPCGRGCGSTAGGSSSWRAPRAAAAVGPGAGVRGDPVRRVDHRPDPGVLAANAMTDDVHMRLTLTRGVKVTSGMDPRLNQAVRR